MILAPQSRTVRGRKSFRLGRLIMNLWSISLVLYVLYAFNLRRTADFLLINEALAFEEFGRDYYLLGLSELKADAKCALLINSGMSEEDKEVRRFLGFTLIEKPCTPKELFDKLQGIVGLDRRQRNP